jgi:type IV secretory pathway VirB9-like protein
MQLGKRSKGIAPTMAYDDGLFTYLRFPNNREMPAVFLVTADGHEGIVNTHVHESRRDVLVVQRVARRLILRLGASVVAIDNQAFDIDGTPPVNGTSVPGYHRGTIE